VHAQRGVLPLGVVLVGDGGAEQRHDLVLDDLVEPAAEGRESVTSRSKQRSTSRFACSGSRSRRTS
jgi:hypothetical protein